ncbi:MAG: cold shock domain-containing protein [Actinomycetales bacterium]|nr:cold shock domain-containing protein [Actinomycetales bacterium]
MPTGKVKWYDPERGFGFVTSDDGQDVFLPSSAVPAGAAVRPGMRVEFGIAEGRRGLQALSLRVVETPTIARGSRRDPEELASLIEDLIKLLDGVGNQLRRGRVVEERRAEKVAAVLRAVAEDLDPER